MHPSSLPVLVGLDADDAARTQRLVDVVRVALGDDPASEVGLLDGPFVRWAMSHGVRPELALAASRVGADEPASSALDRTFRHDQLQALTAAAVSRRLVRCLADQGVEALVLKGVALSVQRGGPATDRPGTDLDLLIRPGDRVAAHRVLTETGFAVHPTVPVPGPDSRTRYLGFTAYETLYVSKVIHLDLHWRLGPVHIDGLSAEALLDRRVDVNLGPTTIPTLHPDDTLAHMILHGAKDRWTSMRSVVDMARLLESSDASWDRAVAHLPRSHAPVTGRAALEFVTNGRLPGDSAEPTRETERDDGLAVWVRGVVERPRPDDDHRPAEGFVRFVRHRTGLAPSVRSTIAVVAHLLLPSTAIARSRLPVRWWWLTVFARPVRIVGQLGTIAVHRLGRRPRSG